MKDNGDRFQDQYVRGDITINVRTLVAVLAILAVLVAAATVASNRRKARNIRWLESRMDALIERHGAELANLSEAVYGVEMRGLEYNRRGFDREDKNLLKFDSFLREYFQFTEVGFSAGFIVPHESGAYAFIGPGGSEYNGTPWHFRKFSGCAGEMLSKGTCSAREKLNDDNYYAFRVIKKPGTSRTAAVFIAAKTEGPGQSSD